MQRRLEHRAATRTSLFGALLPLSLAGAFTLLSATAALAERPRYYAPDDNAEVPSGLYDETWDEAPIEELAPAAPTIPLERAIADEMNLMRRDPPAYAAKLRALRPHFDGRTLRVPGEVPILTQEGVHAVDEAIAVLERARPVPALAWSEGIALAAEDHARDLATNGHVGHHGSDGSSPAKRVERHGKWRGAVAENITFGAITAEEVVIDLLVDDGVADRGHRDVMLADDLRLTGIGCATHPTYRQACVIDYAVGFTPNARARATIAARARASAPVAVEPPSEPWTPPPPRPRRDLPSAPVAVEPPSEPWTPPPPRPRRDVPPPTRSRSAGEDALELIEL